MAAQGNQAAQQNSWGARSCEADAKQFTKCLDENQGNMQICSWYLEQLVSCPCGEKRSKGVESSANRTVFIEGVSECCEPILGVGNGWRCTMNEAERSIEVAFGGCIAERT